MNPAKTLLLTLLTLAPTLHAQTSPDTIYFHGNILTGSHLRADDASSTPARVTALAIAGGKILATGTDNDLLKLKSNKTKLIDLQNAFVMPGFNDAHTHLYSAGFQKKLSVDLDGTRSLSDMQHRIAAYATRTKSVTWIQGAGWDHTLWPTKTLPTRTDIDTVTGNHPALFTRTDGHILVANSAALAAAHITATTPDPPGGKIDRDLSGNPNGIIREDPAMRLLYARIPPPTLEDRSLALTAAIQDALAHGVTSVQDYSPAYENFLILESLEKEGHLPLRISEWQDFNLPLAVLEERRARHAADDPLLHFGLLKGFMDGSLGSRTAALQQPYFDDPGNSGLPRYEQSTLDNLATERAAAGFQLGFHAIGDRANSIALNAFSAAEQVAAPPPAHGDPDATIVTTTSPTFTPTSLRLRIEHAQVVLPQDFDRFAQLGIVASMQPSHLLTDMNWAAARLGPERTKYAYAWRSFLDHGVTLAFGTDYPVEPINPFRGLYSAITRQNEAGTKTFEPQEKITLSEAIYAYTQASAFAEFREDTKGRLEPGFLADFIILDRDITKATPRQLLATRVLRTIVRGAVVYSAPAPAAPKSSSKALR